MIKLKLIPKYKSGLSEKLVNIIHYTKRLKEKSYDYHNSYVKKHLTKFENF